MELAADSAANPEARVAASQTLRDLRSYLKSPEALRLPAAHRLGAIEEIDRFVNRPDEVHKQTKQPETPPGDPIGAKSSFQF
jgi:hypothetical protein